MTEADELAEMRRQYRHANPGTHMLVDGVLYLRCKQCGERPVPHGYSHVMWCDPCIDEALALRTIPPPKRQRG
jgi:hypothetical protein